MSIRHQADALSGDPIKFMTSADCFDHWEGDIEAREIAIKALSPATTFATVNYLKAIFTALLVCDSRAT